MYADTRKSHILNLLNEKSSVSVSELSELLQLSEVSVRKLLDSMEQAGQLKRTWGGAVSIYGSLRELSNDEKLPKHFEEKRAIAQAAYDCIKDGDAIFLDSGTTTIQLARLIVSGTKRNIMVATNATNISMELAKATDIQSIIIGGEFRQKIFSCVGYIALMCLEHLYFDKGFVTGNHFSLEHGFTTPNLQEAEIKHRVLSVSKEHYVLMDYSKFGNDSLALIAPTKEVDNIITDWNIPSDVIQQFNEQGVNVIVGNKTV
jgi:DeoR/GlpR family transcriptional regulator of sugar metabolism